MLNSNIETDQARFTILNVKIKIPNIFVSDRNKIEQILKGTWNLSGSFDVGKL